MNPIFDAWLVATNCWRAGAGLPPLKNPPEPEILNGRDEDYPEADEDEPDRYPDERYLDDPRHGQADDLNRSR